MEVIYKPIESTDMCIELIDQDFHLTKPQASILCTKQDDGLYQLSQLYVLPQFQNKPEAYEKRVLQEAIQFCKAKNASRVLIEKIPEFADSLLPIKLLQTPKTVLALVQHLSNNTTLEFEESYQEWPPIHVAHILYKKEGTLVANGMCDWNMYQKRHFFNLYVKPKFRGSRYGVPVFLGAKQIMSQLSQQETMKFLAEPYELDWSGSYRKIEDKDKLGQLIQWYRAQGSTLTTMQEFSAEMECAIDRTKKFAPPLYWEVVLKKSLLERIFY